MDGGKHMIFKEFGNKSMPVIIFLHGGGSGFVLVMGEITTNAKVDYEWIVRKTLREIGYTDESKGIDAENCEIICRKNKLVI